MTASWSRLAQAVDRTVDETWGERFRIVPWGSESEYVTGQPDAARPPIEIVAEFFADPLSVDTAGMQTRMATADLTISTLAGPLAACGARQGDHVIALDRDNEEFEIDVVVPDGTGRATINLIRAEFS